MRTYLKVPDEKAKKGKWLGEKRSRLRNQVEDFLTAGIMWNGVLE